MYKAGAGETEESVGSPELLHTVKQKPDAGLAGPQPTPVSRYLLGLQRDAGNRAVQRLLAQSAPPITVQRTVEKIGDETVEVANEAEKKVAEEIIKRIKDKFGIAVDSKATIEGIKEQYTDVPDVVKNQLKARKWRLIELEALERALGSYANILGAKRAQSTRAGTDQEVTSVGKVEQAIDANLPTGQLDTTTLGEYFRAKKNMGLFKASEGFAVDFPDEKDQLTGTFIHEIAHGLLDYAIPDYIKATGYWEDRATPLPVSKQTESPPTGYGHKNAAEDICEAAMIYFVKPSQLLNACPKRYAFMRNLRNSWLPPVKQAVPKVIVPTPTTPAPQPASPGGGGVVAPTPTSVKDLLKIFEQVKA